MRFSNLTFIWCRNGRLRNNEAKIQECSSGQNKTHVTLDSLPVWHSVVHISPAAWHSWWISVAWPLSCSSNQMFCPGRITHKVRWIVISLTTSNYFSIRSSTILKDPTDQTDSHYNTCALVQHLLDTSTILWFTALTAWPCHLLLVHWYIFTLSQYKKYLIIELFNLGKSHNLAFLNFKSQTVKLKTCS